MKIERFSKEIVKAGETLLAVSAIYAIEPVRLFGSRGHGSVYYGFKVKTVMGSGGSVTIYGEEVHYYKLDRAELDWNEEEHPMYVDAKVEALTLRDELITIWNDYLMENNNG